MCRRSLRHQRFKDDDELQRRPSGCAGCTTEECSVRNQHAVVLLLMVLVKLTKSPGQNNVMGSTVPFILAGLHLGTLEFAQVFALGTGCAALLQPFFGRALDVAGPRCCIPVGCMILASGMALLGVAREPVHIFFAIVAIRATSIGCLEAWPAATVAMSFKRYRGRAMAVMQVMGGLP